MLDLASRYRLGNGVRSNLAESRQCLFLCAVAGDPSSKLAFANSFSESDPRFESAIREFVSQNHIPRHSSARLVSSQNKTKKKASF
jgi:hypothetical protein